MFSRKFKNDKERIAFLDDFRNIDNGWILWKKDDYLNRRWWRLNLLDGIAFVVEEQLRTYDWPNRHTSWTVMHWYIIEDTEKPFGDNVASKTMALAKLKEIMKKR
jgi:hypothetical protein